MCNPQRSDLFVQNLFHGWQAKEVNADGKKDEEKNHLLLQRSKRPTAMSEDEK